MDKTEIDEIKCSGDSSWNISSFKVISAELLNDQDLIRVNIDLFKKGDCEVKGAGGCGTTIKCNFFLEGLKRNNSLNDVKNIAVSKLGDILLNVGSMLKEVVNK